MIFDWIFDRRWAQSRLPTPDERRIIAIILGKHDPRLTGLNTYLDHAHYVTRTRIDTTSYSLAPVWTSDISSIALTSPIKSRPFVVHDIVSGATLRFVLRIYDGGAFDLIGQTVDGSRWPRYFRLADDAESQQPPDHFVDLPAQPVAHDVTLLARWLGIPQSSLDSSRLRMYASATDGMIEAVQRKEGVAFPKEIIALLRLTDGLAYDDNYVLGTASIYSVSLAQEATKLVVIASHEELGVVVCRATTDEESRVWLLPVGARSLQDASEEWATVKEFVRRSVLGATR